MAADETPSPEVPSEEPEKPQGGTPPAADKPPEAPSGGSRAAVFWILALIVFGAVQVYLLMHQAAHGPLTPGAPTTAQESGTRPPVASRPLTSGHVGQLFAVPPGTAATGAPSPRGRQWSVAASANNQYQFEYPTTWKLSQVKERDAVVVSAPAPSTVSVAVLPFSFTRQPQAEVAAAEGSIVGPGSKLVRQSKLSANGHDIYRRSYTVTVDGKLYQVEGAFVIAAPICFPLVMKGDPNDVKSQADVFDHMTYTFQTGSHVAPSGPGPGPGTRSSAAKPSPTGTSAPAAKSPQK